MPILSKLAKEFPSFRTRQAGAKAMGFSDKDWYHGTVYDVEEFSPTFIGSGTGGISRGLFGKKFTAPGYFFSDNPRVAGFFAELSKDRFNQPPFVDMNKFSESLGPGMLKWVNRDPELKSMVDVLDSTHMTHQFQQNLLSSFSKRVDEKMKNVGSKIIPARLKMKNPRVIDLNSEYLLDTGNDPDSGLLGARILKQFRPSALPEALEQAVKDTLRMNYKEGKEFDGIIFKNASDGDELGSNMGTVAMVFEPHQIRSKFAKFDPAQHKSGNLLAGGAGAAVIGAGAISSQAEAEEALRNPISHGAGGFAKKASEVIDAPAAAARRAMKAIIEGRNPIQAAIDDGDIAGIDIAQSFMKRTNLAFPTPDGGSVAPLAAPVGAALDLAVDPLNLVGMGIGRGSLNAIKKGGVVEAMLKSWVSK